MEALLVLGIIPGTDFQIDFSGWVLSLLLLGGLLLGWTLFHNRYKIELVLFFLTIRWRGPISVMPRSA